MWHLKIGRLKHRAQLALRGCRGVLPAVKSKQIQEKWIIQSKGAWLLQSCVVIQQVIHEFGFEPEAAAAFWLDWNWISSSLLQEHMWHEDLLLHSGRPVRGSHIYRKPQVMFTAANNKGKKAWGFSKCWQHTGARLPLWFLQNEPWRTAAAFGPSCIKNEKQMKSEAGLHVSSVETDGREAVCVSSVPVITLREKRCRRAVGFLHPAHKLLALAKKVSKLFQVFH